jgi:hypothetical protein
MENTELLEENVKKAIKEYQCSGCMEGCDTECFGPANSGCGCGKHYAGTMIFPGVGKIFLGMPKGFNRLGKDSEMKPYIFEKFEDGWGYDKFNIPVWKHLNKDGHTIVRGLSPRINVPFIHIFLEDCREKIQCHEITDDDINEID